METLGSLSLALNRPNGPSLDQQVGQLFAQGEQGAWYDPTALDPTWRRNLLSYSEQFDNSIWTKSSVTVSANSLAAPDGSISADTLTASGANGTARQAITLAAVSYVFSVWLQRKTGTGNIDITVDGSTYVTVSIDSTWKRFETTLTPTSGSKNPGVRIVTSGDEVYAWGAQLEVGTTATPYQRIVTPEITYQADVNPMPTMYQESTGATPVATVETAVGLILDKSKNAIAGSELAPNTGTSLTGWTTGTANGGILNSTANGIRISVDGISGQGAGFSITATAKKFYLISATFEILYGSIVVQTGVSVIQPAVGITNLKYILYSSTGTTEFKRASSGIATDGYVRNISIKQIDGNHAYQTTSASRPILRARYNLLTYSEQFDNAAWTKLGTTCTGNATTAPDGTSTADAIYENNQNSGHGIRYASFAVLSGARYTFSVYAKYNGRKNIAIGGYGVNPVAYYSFNLVDGTSFFYGAGGALVQPESFSIKDVGSGWYRLSITYVSTGTGSKTLEIVGLNDDATTGTYQGDITKGFYLWGAQVNSGTSALSYQRIAASTDYALGPDFPPYLSFDGTDDSLITGSIDFSAKDEISVFAGLMKESASQGMVAELTATIASNNGAFSLEAPDGDIAADNYVFSSKGTSKASCTVNGYAAPTRNVVTGLADISVPTVQTRVDGVAATAVTTDQGTGNFSNAVLYLGRRNQATLPFKGRIHGLVIRGASSTPTEIASAESLMAQKVKVTL